MAMIFFEIFELISFYNFLFLSYSYFFFRFFIKHNDDWVPVAGWRVGGIPFKVSLCYVDVGCNG
jgi:hypothetical protein